MSAESVADTGGSANPVYTSLLANLRVIGALGLRATKQTLRRPQLFAPLLIFPSLFLLVNVGGASHATELPGFPPVRGFLDFEFPGAMVQALMMCGLTGGIALALDIEMGFTDRLIAAPISRFAIVLGRLIATAVAGLIVAIWFIAIAYIFGAQVHAGIGGVVLMLLLAPLAAVAFGSFGAALALRSGRASSVQGLFPIVFVVLFVSSAFFPVNLMVEPAATIAQGNPLSFVAEGLRDPVISAISAAPLAKALGAIAAMLAAGLLLSAMALRARLRSL